MNALWIKDLKVSFVTKQRELCVIDHFDLKVQKGQIISIVGESGCGKSIFLHSIVRLLPLNAKLEGEILYENKDLSKLPESKLRKIRGKEIGFVMQNPGESLNPLLKNGKQVEKVLELDGMVKRSVLNERVQSIFEKVGLGSNPQIEKFYPHQLSGGLQQRLLTGIGVARKPNLLLADEPTKGLDTILRNKIAKMFKDLVYDSDRTLIYVTHDLHLARIISDKIVVMYAGQIVEEGNASEVFHKPMHPYTKGLINSLPSRGMIGIKGKAASLGEKKIGCSFCARCEYAQKSCSSLESKLIDVDAERKVRCNLYA